MHSFHLQCHSRALLRWVLVLASGVGLGLAAVEPALPAGPSASPEAAASAVPSDVSPSLEEARAAKRAAASYQTAGALPQAAAHWIQAAQAYERAGNFGEAALAWTEAASLHEQQNEPHAQVQALIHLGYALQQVGQYHQAMVALQAARRIAEETERHRLAGRQPGPAGEDQRCIRSR